VTASECPRKVSSFFPVAASQIAAVRSFDAVARRVPSGLYCTHQTAPVCPRSVSRGSGSWAGAAFSGLAGAAGSGRSGFGRSGFGWPVGGPGRADADSTSAATDPKSNRFVTISGLLRLRVRETDPSESTGPPADDQRRRRPPAALTVSP